MPIHGIGGAYDLLRVTGEGGGREERMCKV